MILIGFSTAGFAQTNDTITTKSGLKYFVTQHGTGERTKQGWLLLVHYTGTFLDGKKFDSSVDRDEPFSFVLGKGQVIKGWDEGLSLLNVGDKATFIIPYELAYGENGRATIPPKSTLIFDVEVLMMKEKSLGMALSEILDPEKPKTAAKPTKKSVKKPAKRKKLTTEIQTADTTVNINAALAEFQRLKATRFKDLYMNVSDLNNLGYRLLNKTKNSSAAVEIMKLNVELYPESANVYDSLGEAYMMNGDIELAIQNYKIAITKDPHNSNAVDMLVKLQNKK